MGWYTDYAADIAFLALLILGILGAAVSFVDKFTKRTWAKRVFAGLFVFFAVVAWHANKRDREYFEASLTGGDNYCYLAVRKDGEKFMWQRHNSGKFQIPQMQFGIYRKDVAGKYELLFGQYREFTCLPESIDAPAFKWIIGEFKIHFPAKNGIWDEYLTLRKENGFLIQEILIEREGHAPVRLEPSRFPL